MGLFHAMGAGLSSSQFQLHQLNGTHISKHLLPLQSQTQTEAGQAQRVQTFRGGGHGRHLQVIQIVGTVWHNVHLHVPLRETAADNTW